MKTFKRPTFGPADHGRPITEELASIARWRPGYQYEIIHGRISVSPLPNYSHDLLSRWLERILEEYASAHSEVFNEVTSHGRVFVPVTEALTAPEPDLCVFKNPSLRKEEKHRMNWQDHHPLLVVEIISESNSDKDETRNVALYLQVPSIREYWILDPREDPCRPSMTVYRRRGKKWQKPISIPGGGVYESPKFLPGFRLVLD